MKDKKVIAIDLETHTFRPYEMAPKIVCMSWADNVDNCIVKDTIPQALLYNLKQVVSGKILLVGHNIAYDMACIIANYPNLMELVFAAYDADGIACTGIREKLLDIGIGEFKKGNYSLAKLTKKYFDEDLDKGEGSWRLKYAELEKISTKDWPEAAKEYALKDAKFTYGVYNEQEVRIKKENYNLPTQFEDVRADFALKLMSTWGITPNEKSVLRFWNVTVMEMHVLARALSIAGLGREYLDQLSLFPENRLEPPSITKTTEKIRKAVLQNYPGEIPTTEQGAVSTNKETLQECNSEPLKKLIKFNELQKLSSTYISKLFEPIIHAYFQAVGASSGRTSCDSPNLQNQPRKVGIRECFEPREGSVFLACDFDAQEMRTLAQSCLDIVGKSKLAERFQKDVHFDPHLEFAQVLGGDHMRQEAKVANFGFPGGMYPKSFVRYAKGSWGLEIDYLQANTIRENWLIQWHEMNAYFKHVSVLVGVADIGTQVIPRSGFKRGLINFKEVCNGYFQTLAAHASKSSLWEVIKKCYINRNSYLYGSRPVLFGHDEIMLETLTEAGHKAAIEIETTMQQAMQKWTPDVPCAASAVLMNCWSKKAKRVFKKGRLVAWEGK